MHYSLLWPILVLQKQTFRKMILSNLFLSLAATDLFLPSLFLTWVNLIGGGFVCFSITGAVVGFCQSFPKLVLDSGVFSYWLLGPPSCLSCSVMMRRNVDAIVGA